MAIYSFILPFANGYGAPPTRLWGFSYLIGSLFFFGFGVIGLTTKIFGSPKGIYDYILYVLFLIIGTSVLVIFIGQARKFGFLNAFY